MCVFVLFNFVCNDEFLVGSAIVNSLVHHLFEKMNPNFKNTLATQSLEIFDYDVHTTRTNTHQHASSTEHDTRNARTMETFREKMTRRFASARASACARSQPRSPQLEAQLEEPSLVEEPIKEQPKEIFEKMRLKREGKERAVLALKKTQETQKNETENETLCRFPNGWFEPLVVAPSRSRSRSPSRSPSRNASRSPFSWAPPHRRQRKNAKPIRKIQKFQKLRKCPVCKTCGAPRKGHPRTGCPQKEPPPH